MVPDALVDGQRFDVRRLCFDVLGLLEAQVAKLAGSRINATYREDKALLGGAVVKIGSTVYDGSIRAQLNQLKRKLVNA